MTYLGHVGAIDVGATDTTGGGVPVYDLQGQLIQAQQAGDWQLADYLSAAILGLGGGDRQARPVVQGPGGLTVDPNAGYAGSEVMPQPGWLPPALADIWAQITGNAPAPAPAPPVQTAGISPAVALVLVGALLWYLSSGSRR